MTPPVEPVYNESTTTIIVLITIICFLIVIFLIFLCLWLNSRHNNTERLNQPNQTEISQDEQQLIDKYRRLKNSDKNVINQMINSLDNKSDKE